MPISAGVRCPSTAIIYASTLTHTLQSSLRSGAVCNIIAICMTVYVRPSLLQTPPPMLTPLVPPQLEKRVGNSKTTQIDIIAENIIRFSVENGALSGSPPPSPPCCSGSA